MKEETKQIFALGALGAFIIFAVMQCGKAQIEATKQIDIAKAQYGGYRN